MQKKAGCIKQPAKPTFLLTFHNVFTTTGVGRQTESTHILIDHVLQGRNLFIVELLAVPGTRGLNVLRQYGLNSRTGGQHINLQHRQQELKHHVAFDVKAERIDRSRYIRLSCLVLGQKVETYSHLPDQLELTFDSLLSVLTHSCDQLLVDVDTLQHFLGSIVQLGQHRCALKRLLQVVGVLDYVLRAQQAPFFGLAESLNDRVQFRDDLQVLRGTVGYHRTFSTQ